jgi:hypothetical protein
VREGVKTIAAAFEAAAAKEQFTCFIEEGAGHDLTAEMWKRARECFAKTLRG